MRNLIRALRGKPVELSEKQQAKMAKMQARADAMIAEQDAKGRAAMEEAARFQPSQAGGASVGGPAPAAPALDPMNPGSVKDMFKAAFESARDSVGDMFDDRSGIIDPGPGANFNRPPPELEDDAERAQWAAAEREARDEARAPYRAAAPPSVERTRFATTGREQMEDVTERLRAYDPARVFGVYRVPDRYELKRNNENKVRVEWEIAHAPGAAAAPGSAVHMAAFNRSGLWVARRFGEPSVLDEDVAGELVRRANLQPEDCFGLPRLLQVRASDSEAGKDWRAHVEGILVFARPPLAAAHEQLQQAVPLALATAPPFHVEILDWEAVAAWVAPSRYGPPRTPSPLPHLPSSWEELMTAYLEVVGVRSGDCYSVQATRADTVNGLADLSMASFRKNLRGAPELIHVAEHVVIVYRDRAEYEAGRARWRAYQDEVLHAKLDHRSGQRPPLDTEYHPPPSFLSEVFDMFNPLDPMHMFPQIFNRNERPQLGPYCGTVED
jgi:hypothetical protein